MTRPTVTRRRPVGLVLPEDQPACPGERLDVKYLGGKPRGTRPAPPVEIVVDGGNSDQSIDGFYFQTMTQYRVGDDYTDGVVDEQELHDGFDIAAGESRTIETDLFVHRLTPVTMGKTKVWIDTGMDIDRAKDSSDRDPLEVERDPVFRTFLDAIENLGFEYDEIDCTPAADDAAIPRPYLQEFDVVPTRSSRFHGDVTELDCYPMLEEDGSHLLGVELEFDDQARVASAEEFSFDVSLGQVGDSEDDEVLVSWETGATDVSVIEDQIVEIHT